MEKTSDSDSLVNAEWSTPWSEAQAVELWKYFGGIGGGDKNTMIQVCNWLLAFSAILLAFLFNKDLPEDIFSKQVVFVFVALFGVATSVVSALVALTYAGYANRNWAKADQIARVYKWSILYPDDVPWTEEQKKNGLGLLAKCVRYLSAPTPTYHGLAPIFIIYFGLSLLSAAAHSVLMVCAARLTY